MLSILEKSIATPETSDATKRHDKKNEKGNRQPNRQLTMRDQSEPYGSSIRTAQCLNSGIFPISLLVRPFSIFVFKSQDIFALKSIRSSRINFVAGDGGFNDSLLRCCFPPFVSSFSPECRTLNPPSRILLGCYTQRLVQTSC